MDDDIVIERIRSGAERLDADGTDVGALVHGALRQGHRRRTRRRALGAGLTGLVVAGLVVAAVGTGLPGVLRDGSTGVPAASPPVATATAPVTSTAPSASPTPSTSPSPRTTGKVSGKPVAVQQTLTRLLPRSSTVTRGSAAREEGSNGFPWENNAALTVHDSQGTTQVYGGIGHGHYDDACFGYQHCERSTLPDGSTLWTSTSTGVDKTGTDRNWYLNRPDGGHVWLSETNYLGGNDPVTRKGTSLSWDTGTGIVTDPAWDALFTG